jgi:hypothetical protein
VNAAEIFDPASGTFTAASKMASARIAHTMTLLPDGRVLVAGGLTTYDFTVNATLVTATAEGYNPDHKGFEAFLHTMNSPRAFHSATLLNDGRVLLAGGERANPPYPFDQPFSGTSTAEVFDPGQRFPAPRLFSLSRDGRGQGAVWHSSTGQLASPDNPASAGELLSMYTDSLFLDSSIPPRVAVGGRMADVTFFGPAPGFGSYFQVNFRMPASVPPGPSVPLRLTYFGRWSNAVSVSVQ